MIFLKILQGLFLLLVTALLSAGTLLTVSAFKWSQELPSFEQLNSYEFTETSMIYSRDGEIIGEILPVLGETDASTDRIPVTLDEVSPAALMAIISSEDDQFFNHYGFDIPAIVKAAYLLATGEGGRGGSTITTQVIKNTLLSDIAGEESIERKAKEVMLAVELERRLTKTEILQRYVNVAFWGGNLYGIRAAARAYFDKEPISLSLAEGLYLARLIPTPSANYQDFETTRTAMRNVLSNMVTNGVISQQTAERAWKEKIQPRGWRVTYNEDGSLISAERTGERLSLSTSVTSNLAPHITFAVRNELQERFGYERLFNEGGLRVYTTIDAQMQRTANQASLRADIPPGTQVAIVALDPETGEVLAMIGERLQPNTPIGELNRANYEPGRQPGSSFKPIIYATAIDEGRMTQATLINDNETTFITPAGQENWKPRNHDNTFDGVATLRYHLDVSRNIPVAKLVEALGPEIVAQRSQELGYKTVQPTLSLSLGSYEVTPLQHASGMGAFANGGVHVEPHLVQRVEDSDGNILYEAQPRRHQVWTPQTAYIMLDMLRGNVRDSGAFSRRASAGLEDRFVAGKTGTTNDEHDIWFVGMTPGMVAAVWIGFDDPEPIPTRMPDNERVTSSRQPIYVWSDFMTNALQGRNFPTDYERPEGITFYNIDLRNGTAGGAVRAAFLTGTSPNARGAATGPGAVMVHVAIDKRTGTRATASTPVAEVEWRQVPATEVSSYY